MTISIIENSHMPFVRDFSTGNEQLSKKALRAQRQRELKNGEAHNHQAGEITEDTRRKLRDVVGTENLVALRRLMSRERLSFRDLLQPPQGLTADYEQLNKARKRKGDSLLRKLRVPSEKIKRIGLEYGDKLRKALSPVEGKIEQGYNLSQNLQKWTDLSPFHKFPLPWGDVPDIGSDDPHRWFLFRPPFFGFDLRATTVVSDNARVDWQNILEPPIGLVGNEQVSMDIDGADDADYASIDVFSAIAFAFEAPTTGIVEVLIDAQNIKGTHDLRTVDEWGWSNSGTGQTNYLMMHALHPNVSGPSFAEMSSFSWDTDDDTNVHRENLSLGQHYFAHLFSPGVVPGGASIVIEAGTRSFDITGTNDVSIHSKSSFQWFINSVEVRISP
jgi:hypothetical protein